MEVIERELPITRAISNAVALQGNVLTGYAIVYNVPSVAPVPIGNDYLTEVIDRGAFAQSLTSGKNISLTFAHKDYAEYADTKSKTLRPFEDDKGIRFEADLPAYANTLRQEIASGAIREMSFGFVSPVMEIQNDIRHIIRAELLHISPVYTPAYDATSVSVRKPVNYANKKKMIAMKEK